MPVSRLRSFAFIHIRKTAGESILRVLREIDPNLLYAGRGVWDILVTHPQRNSILAGIRKIYPMWGLGDFSHTHFPAPVLRQLIGKKEWDRLFVFAFVRNPWDLVVSAYHHNLQKLDASLEPDIMRLMGYCRDFSHFVRLYPLIEAGDMSSMITDSGGSLMVDFVGRFESLDADFAKICEALSLQRIAIPRINTTEHRHYRAYYTPELAEIVGRYFERDISRFGYSF